MGTDTTQASNREVARQIPLEVSGKTLGILGLGVVALCVAIVRFALAPRAFDTARMIAVVAGFVLIVRASIWIGRALRRRAFLRTHCAFRVEVEAAQVSLHYRGGVWQVPFDRIAAISRYDDLAVIWSALLPDGFCVVNAAERERWVAREVAPAPEAFAAIRIPQYRNIWIRAPWGSIGAGFAVLVELLRATDANWVLGGALLVLCGAGFVFFVVVAKPFQTATVPFLGVSDTGLEIGDLSRVTHVAWDEVLLDAERFDGTLWVRGVPHAWQSLLPPDIAYEMLARYQKHALACAAT